MPGLVGAQRNDQLKSNATSYFSLTSKNGSVCSSSNGFWSKHRDDIDLNQLQKFWSELSSQARQDLLRIDKQTLFEQARKNMYCSRCNGLLLEGFVQIVMYGKSLQQEGVGGQLPFGSSKDQMRAGSSTTTVCQDETQDPSVHPWGGLSTTRDGALTLLDCYLYSRSLQGLQNVFNSARARERERELLYPDACGGGGRGWISQGIASYGRGHGTRETCALHTARLACDTLVDFWSALGEETRQSLLRMREEDFIERLMYRFDSKRFCRDCRRNVIREFKELKDLKRMRREPRCTSWFCVADTAFQYEVSNDTVYADWHQTFFDSIGTCHHFEWAVGSGEGKSDILEFENVGMNGSVRVNGLDLAGLNACYITLRAWKLDGRCTEFCVKAHALKGRQCVHCKLVVGDGFVTITHGEDIRRFFEHAEEAEEEEDDDTMDKDGNDLDGECSRPQKHAKSPELAREFLLDAATVIFKEQVEKAFREGTARQNAHSIFVCLALKLLEERIHVACKEIITLEKQMKLLEEEEKEKREEEERKERRRTKEREKKLRRKERLRGKEKNKKCSELDESPLPLDVSDEVSMSCTDEQASNCIRDSVSETGDTNLSESASPGVLDESSSNDYATPDFMYLTLDGADEELADVKEESVSFMFDSLKGTRRKWADRRRSTENGPVAYKSESRYYEDSSEPLSNGVNCFSRQPKAVATKFSARNSVQRFGQKVQCSNMRAADRSEPHSCGCNQPNDHRARVEPHSSMVRFSRETRSVTKMESASDMSRPVNRINKFNQVDYMRDNCGRTRTKVLSYSNAVSRESPYTKKVWEPVEPQKRYPRSNSDSDVTLRSCSLKTEIVESERSLAETCSGQISEKIPEDSQVDITSGNFSVEKSRQSGFQREALYHPKEAAEETDINGVSDISASSSSISDNCSSSLSEGDSNTPSSNQLNQESSSTSDSEDSSQLSEGRQSSDFVHNGSSDGADAETEKVGVTADEAADSTQSSGSVSQNIAENTYIKSSNDSAENGNIAFNVASVQGALPSTHNPNISFPFLRGPSTVGYYHQNPVPWSTAPPNGLMTYPQPNHYLMPSPFGYGLSGDAPFCMQYGSVQHLASPFMNSTQIPVYQPLPRDSSMNPPEQISALKANGGRDLSSEHGRENVASVANGLTEVLPKGGIEKVNPTKLDAGNAGFSLFQFGGPVALSSQSSDEGKAAVFSCCHVEGDHACSKEDYTVEEYNLFGKEWNTVLNLLV